ncbi:MAG: hypothetical protein GY906_22440 [bacterium]|nr:hypothetical protein [bacterium]
MATFNYPPVPQILLDPEFRELPLDEQVKVVQWADPEFTELSKEEQHKFLADPRLRPEPEMVLDLENLTATPADPRPGIEQELDRLQRGAFVDAPEQPDFISSGVTPPIGPAETAVPIPPGAEQTGLPGIPTPPDPVLTAAAASTERALEPPSLAGTTEADVPGLLDTFMRAGSMGVHGVLSTAGSGFEALGTILEQTPDVAMRKTLLDEAGAPLLKAVGKEIQKFSKQAIEGSLPATAEKAEKFATDPLEAPWLLLDAEYIAHHAGNAGGSMLTFLMPMARMLKGINTVSGAAKATGALSLSESFVNAGETYDTAKEYGKSDKAAGDLFVESFAKDVPVTAALNFAGLLNPFIRNRGVRALAGGVSEPVQEVLQGATGRSVLQEAFPGMPEFYPWEGSGIEALGGFLGGVGAGAIVHPSAASKPKAKAEPPTEIPIDGEPPITEETGITETPWVRLKQGGETIFSGTREAADKLLRKKKAKPPKKPEAVPEEVSDELYGQISDWAKDEKRPYFGKTKLRREFGISLDQAGQVLDRMVNEGLVERQPDGSVKAPARGAEGAPTALDVSPAIEKPEEEAAGAPAPPPAKAGKGQALTEARIKEKPSAEWEQATMIPVEELRSIAEFDRRDPKQRPKTREGLPTEQYIDQLAADMAENGVETPLILWYDPKRNLVRLVEGNFRLAASEKSGHTQLPARIQVGEILSGGVTTPKALAGAVAPSSRVFELPVDSIAVDPVRFQFKRETGGKAGVSETLKDVEKFVPKLGGEISVWKDPADGKTYVVNGHHRLELAQRTGQKNIDVQYLDADTAQEARAEGALINIAEGRGSAIDAATLFRDMGITPEKLQEHSITLREPLAREGVALSRLTAPIFEMVTSGDLDLKHGAIIGDTLAEPADQKAALELLNRAQQKGKRLTNSEVETLARRVTRAERVSETEQTLFGDVEVLQNLAVEEAQLDSYIRKRLSREKKLFEMVGKEAAAAQLGEAGNVIQAERNAAIAKGVAESLEIYDKLALRSGPVDDAIRKGAKDLASGKNANAVREEAYGAVREAVSSLLGRKAQTVSTEGEETAGQLSGPAAPATPGLLEEAEAEPVELTPAEQRREGQRGSLSPKPIPDEMEGFESALPPEAAAEFEAAAEVPAPSAITKWKNRLSRGWHAVSRSYLELDRKLYGGLIFELQRLEKQRSVAIHDASQAVIDTVGSLDQKQYREFIEKVIIDDMVETHDRMTKDGTEWNDLPFKLTPEQLKESQKKATAAADADPAIQKAISEHKRYLNEAKTELIEAMRAIDRNDVAEKLNREDYYHHRVIEYIEEQVAAGNKDYASAARELSSPRSSYMRGRVANPLNFSTDYLQAQFEVLQQMMWDARRAEAIAWIEDEKNGINETGEFKQKAHEHNKSIVLPKLEAAAKEQDTTPEKLYKGLTQREIQDLAGEHWINPADPKRMVKAFGRRTHEVWQPDKGNVFYSGQTVEEKLAEQILEAGGKEVGITADDLRRALLVGGKRRQIILTKEVAATLKDFGDADRGKGVERAMKVAFGKTLRAWKQWMLLMPTRAIKYNLRNLSGDAEATFVGNPKAFRQLRRAMKDLKQMFFGDGEMSPELRTWFDRGGIGSLLQVQEIGDLNRLEQLESLVNRRHSKPNLLKRAWNSYYWGTVQKATNFRESVLRYANYLEYLDQLEKTDGQPANYGASLREEVDALDSIHDKAFKLSNDMIGAYDDISVAGQAIRKYFYPFWSFQEINARRYGRLYRNAASDGKLATTVGRKVLGKAASPYTLYRIGSLTVKVLAFKALMAALNDWRSPEEEKDIPENERQKTHIVLGRTEDGKVVTFNRIGIADDFLEWFGLDGTQEYARQYLNGRRTLREIAVEMAKSPANKIASGLMPQYKLIGELGFSRSAFPDVFKPRTIHDRQEFLATQLGVPKDAYRKLVGKPAPKNWATKALWKAVVYEYDPGEIAYYGAKDEVRRFNKDQGYGDVSWGGDSSGKSEALYNVKQAWRYKDGEALERHLAEYFALGGNLTGIKTSLQNMDPLNDIRKKDRKEFLESLDGEQKEQLTKAEEYWNEVLKGKVKEIMGAAKQVRTEVRAKEKAGGD